jgi:WD40 repeat protein
LVVKDELIGKRVKCPACGEKLLVEEPNLAKKPRRAAANEEPPAPAKKLRPIAPASEDRTREDEPPARPKKKSRPDDVGPEDEGSEDKPRRRQNNQKKSTAPSWQLWAAVGVGTAAVAAAVVIVVMVLSRDHSSAPASPPGGPGHQQGGDDGAVARVGVQAQPQNVCLASAPDGKHLATYLDNPPQDSDKHKIKIWDLTTGQVETKLDPHSANHLAYSPDGKLLASSSSSGSGGEMKVWDLTTGRLRHAYHRRDRGGPTLGELLAFSPDGKYVVSLIPGACVLLNVANGNVEMQDVAMPWARSISTTQAACSPVEPIVAIAEVVTPLDVRPPKVAIIVYDYARRQVRRQVPLPELSVELAFSADGATLAVATSAGPIQVFDAKTWALRAALERQHEDPETKRDAFSHYRHLALTPDGTSLCAVPQGAGRPQAEVWPVGAHPLRTLEVGWCFNLALAPDGKTVAIATDEGVRFVDPTTGKEKPSGVSEPAKSGGGGRQPPYPAREPVQAQTGHVEVLFGVDNYEAVTAKIKQGQTIKVKGIVSSATEDANRVVMSIGEVYTGTTPAVPTARLLKDRKADKEAFNRKYGGPEGIVVEGVVDELLPQRSMLILGPAADPR